jgi:hypothetical protein
VTLVLVSIEVSLRGCLHKKIYINLVDLNLCTGVCLHIWIYCVAPIRYYLYYKSTYL